MRILLLDNYDSFTYNLEHYLAELHQDITVIRNDKLRLEDIEAYDAVVFSPGPGLPKDAGLMPEIILQYRDKKPMLGVCLGMQAIAESYGGKLNNMKEVYHGIATTCVMDPEDPLFYGLESENLVGRYHSWEVLEPLPEDLMATARDKEHNTLMALKHKHLPVWGVQFHPESILTPNGKHMLRNWLQAAKKEVTDLIQ